MHILYLSDVYFPRVNGVSTSIQTFRRELNALGVRVTLIAPHYPGPHQSEPDLYRVPSRRVPLDPEDRAMRWQALLDQGRALRGRGIDLVHIQTPFLAHYAGTRLAREWGLPCVATYHTLFEEYLFHYVPFAPKERMRALARWFSRRQCNALDAVVAPSTAMRATLQRYGVRTDVHVIPTGIPLSAFGTGDGARFRAERGIAPSRPLLLFVGRVAFEKNIDFLLRMHARLLQQRPDALLLICGEGPAQAALQRLAADLGIAHAVCFVGYLDRATALPDCYCAADVFVFASRTETQGLVLLEAMALGVPVVSTAVMGTKDIVGPQRGAVVAPEDEQEFAAAVATLLRDTAKRTELAAEAVQYAQSWSAPAAAMRMATLYRQVLLRRMEQYAAPIAPAAENAKPR